MKKCAYKLQRFADGDIVTYTLNTKTQLYKTLYGIHKYLDESHITYGASTLWHRPAVSNYIADNRKALGLPACKKRSILLNRISANMTHLFNLAFIDGSKEGGYHLLSEWTEENTNEPFVKILQDSVRGKVTKKRGIAKAATKARATSKAKSKTKATGEVRAKAKIKEATVMVVARLPIISELTGETTLIKDEYPIKKLVKIFESRITSMGKNDCILVDIEKGRLVIGIPLLQDCNNVHPLDDVRVLTKLKAISMLTDGTVHALERYPTKILVPSFERILKNMPYEDGIILEIKEDKLTFSFAIADNELSDLLPGK